MDPEAAIEDGLERLALEWKQQSTRLTSSVFVASGVYFVTENCFWATKSHPGTTNSGIRWIVVEDAARIQRR